MIKTEGIPYLCEPNFEPAEVRIRPIARVTLAVSVRRLSRIVILSLQVLEFARTTLAFLQRNCTTDNATYWLLRDASSDQVQLFDVTALLSKSQHNAAPDSTSQRVTGAPSTPGSVRAAPVHGAFCVALRGPVFHPLFMVLLRLRLSARQESASLPAPPEGSTQSLSSSSMGILCLRLAEKLPQAPSSEKSQDVILRDKWLLLHRAALLIDKTLHPGQAASALQEMGLLLLRPGAEALAREFLAQDADGEAAGEGAQERCLRLPSPLRERERDRDHAPADGQLPDEQQRRAIPPLLFTGSLFAGADEVAAQVTPAESPRFSAPSSNLPAPVVAPVSEQLWAAWRLLRRARKVLLRGRAEAEASADETLEGTTLRERAVRLGCQEAGCCFELARRRYGSGALGEALALAQVRAGTEDRSWRVWARDSLLSRSVTDAHLLLYVVVRSGGPRALPWVPDSPRSPRRRPRGPPDRRPVRPARTGGAARRRPAFGLAVRCSAGAVPTMLRRVRKAGRNGPHRHPGPWCSRHRARHLQTRAPG